jgi:hypothetical protein
MLFSLIHFLSSLDFVMLFGDILFKFRTKERTWEDLTKILFIIITTLRVPLAPSGIPTMPIVTTMHPRIRRLQVVQIVATPTT